MIACKLSMLKKHLRHSSYLLQCYSDIACLASVEYLLAPFQLGAHLCLPIALPISIRMTVPHDAFYCSYGDSLY